MMAELSLLSFLILPLAISRVNLEIKNADGTTLSSVILSILLYADDIVLFASSEESLQSMLNIVQIWCEKYRLQLNLSKTNILHVHNKRKAQSKIHFSL